MMRIPRVRRRQFARDLLLVLLLLSAAILVAAGLLSSRTRQEIAQKYIDNATSNAVRQFGGMVDSMTQPLEMAGDWAGSGKLSLNRVDALDDLLFPLLKRDRVLYGISVADTQGRSYYLTAHGDGWQTQWIEDAGSGRESVVRYWDAANQEVSEETEPTTYDPRSRPWFSPALATEEVFWTQPYIFADRDVAGITASIAREVDEGKSQLVVAFDILLTDLFREIQRMAPTKNSRVLVFRNDARVYVPGGGNQAPEFLSLAEVDDPLIRKMAAAGEKLNVPSDEAFSMNHDRQRWWCGFQAMKGANRNVLVGVLVPESDIIGDAGQGWFWPWIVGAAVLLLAGALALFMIRRYGRSFDRPDDRYDDRHPEESVRRLIAKGEGDAIEFKSTMRMNLHTQKAGKEIELAWLKAVVAFMNTDGGAVLLGVSDDGAILGLESDEFANDDKCRLHFKNLINQHIGAELYQYLSFHLVTVDGRQIGVVSCSRSPEPAYLKTAKAEEFYIRNGPSSESLPVSKIMAYIQNRA